MAVKASASVTLLASVDIASYWRYYLLRSSTLSAPTIDDETTMPPKTGGVAWDVSEPTYTEGSTNTLYTVDCTVYSDGIISYSNVNKSTSYEAAKAAYNKALNAAKTATSFITETTNGVKVHPEGDTESFVYIDSDSVDIYSDGIKLAQFAAGASGGNQVAKITASEDGTSDRALYLSSNGMDITSQSHASVFLRDITGDSPAVRSEMAAQYYDVEGSFSGLAGADISVESGDGEATIDLSVNQDLSAVTGAELNLSASGDSEYGTISMIAGRIDRNCDVYKDGNLIGEIVQKTNSSYTSDVSITTTGTGGVKNIAALTLEAGVWVIVAIISFTPSASGSFRSSVGITTASGSTFTQDRRAAYSTSADMIHNPTSILSLTSQTTVYLTGYSSAKGTFMRTDTNFRFRAVRVA